jgi:hypothetical protein
VINGRKILMNNKAFAGIVCLLLCVLLPEVAPAQDDKGAGRRPDREESQTLTEAQVSAAKALLAKYKPSGLTADDAKAMHRGMRDAGIRAGRAEKELLISTGFDPEVLRTLDPPPDRRDGSTPGEERSGKKRKDGSRKEIQRRLLRKFRRRPPTKLQRKSRETAPIAWSKPSPTTSGCTPLRSAAWHSLPETFAPREQE